MMTCLVVLFVLGACVLWPMDILAILLVGAGVVVFAAIAVVSVFVMAVNFIADVIGRAVTR